MDETVLSELSLNPEDVARVAEFFDCDVDAAFEFMRRIWLPDARETAGRIVRAACRKDWTSLFFLCDHLREGARSVGATRIVQLAGEIEHYARNRSWCGVNRLKHDLQRALDTLSAVLGEAL